LPHRDRGSEERRHCAGHCHDELRLWY
jgi:hypothetical protein